MPDDVLLVVFPVDIIVFLEVCVYVPFVALVNLSVIVCSYFIVAPVADIIPELVAWYVLLSLELYDNVACVFDTLE